MKDSKNISMFFKLAGKFFQRYFLDYFKTILIYSIILIFTLVIFFISLPSSSLGIIAFFGIIALIATSVCFWKIFVAIYSLFPACYEFLKNGARKTLKGIINDINQNELKKFLSFYTIIIVLITLPLISMINKIILSFTSITSISEAISIGDTISNIISRNHSNIFITILLTIIFSPFIVFGFSAFALKKDNEKFMDIFANCYANLNLTGLILLILSLFILYLMNFDFLFSIISTIFLPYFITVITFWYYTRIK